MSQGDASEQIATKAPRGRPKGTRGRPKLQSDTTRSRLKEQKQTFVQEEILHAAAALIAARGFRAVTIDDIAASIGFSKSVVYYYLKSKNDILWRIFSRIYESYFETLEKIAEMDASPDVKLAEIIRQHALNVMNNRDWTAIYFREEAELDDKQRRVITRKKRQYDAMIEKIYCDGVEMGAFRDIPPHVAITGLLGSCNWLSTWFNPAGSMSAVQIADHYTDLLANGFRVSSSAK